MEAICLQGAPSFTFVSFVFRFLSGVAMNRTFAIVVAAFLSIAAAAQTTPALKKSTQEPAGKESASPMPAATKPTAVIDTTAGHMTCTLFPNKSPNRLANFVGLATDANEWKEPKNRKKMRN